MYNLLAFAPYQELSDILKVVSKQYENITMDVYNADLSQATKILEELDESKYDAILSRGGTADLLAKATDLPVIDISISIYDILSSIKLAQSYSDKFIIIAYPSITEGAHLICDILGYNIEILTIHNKIGALEALDQAKLEDYDFILCDAITNKIATSKAMRTFLITSGLDSIKRAIENTIKQADNISKYKIRQLLFESYTNNSDDKILFLDENLNPLYSNLDKALHNRVLKLTNKDSFSVDKTYNMSVNTDSYDVAFEEIIIENSRFIVVNVKKVINQIINNKFGVSIQNREEVRRIFYEKLNTSTHINEEMKHSLANYYDTYSSFIIWGQKGASKTSVAYYYFLHQLLDNKNLITLNTALLNEKIWKYLLNVNNGPILGEDNTIIFKNFEQIGNKDLEKLFTIIHNTNFLTRNKIIFIVNSDSKVSKSLIDRITRELSSGNFYVKSLQERKVELPSLITLILNKLNIECNKNVLGLVPKAMDEMVKYNWPGNISQLQSILKELVLNSNSHYITYRQVVDILDKQEIIKTIDIDLSQIGDIKTKNKMPTMHEYNVMIANKVLEKNNGNKTQTADELGISRTTLWRLIN